MPTHCYECNSELTGPFCPVCNPPAMDEAALLERIKAMSEADRSALDPICEALREYLMRDRPMGGMVLPNRVVAMACVDLAKEWSRRHLERG